MNFRSQTRDDAVSPVVAVILLVAVTVALSAVIGGFALNLGQQATSSPSQTEIGVSESQTDGKYSATVVTGSADELRLLVNGSEVDNISNPSAGDTLTANVSTGDDVTIVSVQDGSKSVVSSLAVSSTSGSSDPLTLSDGLVAHWKFNGNATDSAGPHDGVVYGASPVSDSTRGEVFEYNGTSDFVNISNDANFTTQQRTVSAWVKHDGSSFKQAIITKNFDGSNAQWGLSYDSDNTQLIWRSAGEGISYNYSLPTTYWVLITGTWDGQDLRLYVNDTLVATKSAPNESTDNGRPVSIGARSDWDGSEQNYWGGRIDEVRYYNRTLNATEVSKLYNQTK